MTTTSIDATSIPRIGHDEAMRITAVEFDRMLTLLGELEGDDWRRQTDNDEWDVRATALHVLGAAEANASLRENLSQFTRGRRLFKQIGGHHWVDGINEIQIRDRAGLTDHQITERLAAAAPRAVKVRSRIPAPIRKLRVVDFGPVIGRQTVGYLMDMVYTRDVWMHRVDIARATDRKVEVTADHDGRIVADMVAEWAALFDEPFSLDLLGVAGGSYHRSAPDGSDGEHVAVDAVEFVRTISGRAEGTGLLSHPLPL
ncbi:MAG TPA: maleylpyruvate isomerase family mycothiol-dependent enzyme [Acidimicrobiia bacterium]|nr:maleylpyruvate isomerase family mycothiol-dependent enzyme [Acidimicrobiia bacterium]